MKIEINVTQSDIDLGYQCNPYTCPVARAASRAIEGTYAEVTQRSICLCARDFVWDDKYTHYLFNCPQHVSDWIKAFDTTGAEHVRPFAFTLDTDDAG